MAVDRTYVWRDTRRRAPSPRQRRWRV